MLAPHVWRTLQAKVDTPPEDNAEVVPSLSGKTGREYVDSAGEHMFIGVCKRIVGHGTVCHCNSCSLSVNFRNGNDLLNQLLSSRDHPRPTFSCTTLKSQSSFEDICSANLKETYLYTAKTSCRIFFWIFELWISRNRHLWKNYYLPCHFHRLDQELFGIAEQWLFINLYIRAKWYPLTLCQCPDDCDIGFSTWG